MTRSEIRAVLRQVNYKDWSIKLDGDGGALSLQVIFHDVDGSEQRCRRWLLSADPSPSDVVRTALAAVLAAEEHEAREAFTYQGFPVFSPHLNVADIVHGLIEGDLRQS